MTPDGSVSHWLELLQAGHQEAAQPLWERYFQRLVGLARARIQGAAGRAADEEDVALSAFDSFCRGAEQGRFPRLQDRDDLWRLLVTLTARKASHLVRDERRQKRGGGAAAADPAALERVLGREPDPAFAAQVAEECGRLLGLLDGPGELRQVALWKMEGLAAPEIAQRLGCAPRTVERKLRLIRSLWEKGAP
jgi:DNA-directed RNA polymerase specialized sigma24 family protein